MTAAGHPHDTYGADHPNMAAWHSNLGNVLADLGDLAGARIQYERALAITETTSAPTTPMPPPFAETSTVFVHQAGGK
jgi:hypothetical protein